MALNSSHSLLMVLLLLKCVKNHLGESTNLTPAISPPPHLFYSVLSLLICLSHLSRRMHKKKGAVCEKWVTYKEYHFKQANTKIYNTHVKYHGATLNFHTSLSQRILRTVICLMCWKLLGDPL